MKKDKIVLIGMMGAGKTTLGQLAAKELGWRFVDADAVFVAEAGMAVADFFAHHGEPEFRRRELEVMRRLVADPEPALIASGGGSFCQEPVRRHLRDTARTVFLHVGEDELLRRLELGGVASRPMIAGDGWRERVIGLARSRYPLYSEAEMILDIGPESPEETARRLVAMLGKEDGNAEN